MPEYKNFAKLRKQISAPMPEFALSEERAQEPEYIKARAEEGQAGQAMRDFFKKNVNEKLAEHGMPNSDEPAIACMSMDDIAGAGNIIGSVGAPVAKAASYVEAAARAAKDGPSKFGRVLNIVKQVTPTVPKQQVHFTKIFKAR